MAKIMESDARQILHATDEAGEFVRQAERLMRLAIGTGAQQRIPVCRTPTASNSSAC
jgi:hypothetical protein